MKEEGWTNQMQAHLEGLFELLCVLDEGEVVFLQFCEYLQKLCWVCEVHLLHLCVL